MDMFKVTNEIRSILLNNGDISAMVGRKVFPVIAPENTDGDFIVYQRDGFREEYTKMGVATQAPVVFVIAVSEDYERSQQLASLIYGALSGEWKDPYMLIRLEDSTEDFADKKYIQVLQFSIKN